MTEIAILVGAQFVCSLTVVFVFLYMDKLHDRDMREVRGQLESIHGLISAQMRLNAVQRDEVSARPRAHSRSYPRVVSNPDPVIVKYESDYPRSPTVIGNDDAWNDLVGFGR